VLQRQKKLHTVIFMVKKAVAMVISMSTKVVAAVMVIHMVMIMNVAVVKVTRMTKNTSAVAEKAMDMIIIMLKPKNRMNAAVATAAAETKNKKNPALSGILFV
jgi:hypothetical protein